MSATLRVLLVEDNPGDADLIRKLLRDSGGDGFAVECLTHLAAALERLAGGGIDLVLLDPGLPDSAGLDAFHRVRDAAPEVPIIVVTGSADEKTAIAAVRAGAQDYLIKGQISGDLLVRSTRHAVERKRVEEALRESDRQFRNYFETSADGIAITDLDGRFLQVNRAYLDLLGYDSLEELRGISYAAITPCEYLPLEESIIREQTLARGFCDEYEKEYIRKDGTRVPVSLRGWLVKNSLDQAVGMYVIVRDITARKMMAEELLKVQKLESLSVMAGGIAHDFNNILASILGNVSLARMLLQTNPAKAGERLAEAELASMRAKDLTHQLLTFATGGAPVRAALDIGSLLKESVLFANRGSSVAARFEIEPDLWPAEVDEGQINQIVNNMVLNAVQAMPAAGGTITIRADNIVIQGIEVPTLQPGRYVRFSVRDQGIGIPPHLLGKIFDPFFTTKQQRSGLGLPTVYSIVRNHDGHVTVESTLGVGSVFTIFLPASEQFVSRTAPAAAGIEHFNARILVMDDESMVCDMAQP